MIFPFVSQDDPETPVDPTPENTPADPDAGETPDDDGIEVPGEGVPA